MKKTLIILILFLSALSLPFGAFGAEALRARLLGYILLQVEEHGEAWYIYPAGQKKYYLGRPQEAFMIMKKLSLGAHHDFIANTEIFPARLSGLILLDVDKNGEAYYIFPGNLKKYYLGRPVDAFALMRNLGLGISNADLANFPAGDIDAPAPADYNVSTKILLPVPFTAQAPYGDWQDQRQQDGCEKASALMAVSWARNQNLAKDEALTQILAISDFTQKKYGEYRDLSEADAIAWIYNDYFGFHNVSLKKNITLADIIAELNKGNLLITAMNGQLLQNPYFTPPGPTRHMLVIKGYDPTAKQFITNDPGTRQGESYSYDIEIFFNAIRSYPTGYHEEIAQIEKNMLVVWK